MSLIERTKIAFDEVRMLMLGAQILLGFQLHAPFQDAFSRLTRMQRINMAIALYLMVIVIGLLIAPAARHRIVDKGEATVGVNRFVTAVADVILAPFAIALTIDLTIAAQRSLGTHVGISVGLFGGLIAVLLWYGPLALRRKAQEDRMAPLEKTSVNAKIDFVLTEARVVLPGAQALLGFQFAIVLTSAFGDLPYPEQAVHGAALASVALATMLLMAPAAYHRIVYDGAAVPRFHVIASRFLLAATIFLALGLAADIHVVTVKLLGDYRFAAVTAAGTAVLLMGLWYVWPWSVRMQSTLSRKDHNAL